VQRSVFSICERAGLVCGIPVNQEEQGKLVWEGRADAQPWNRHNVISHNGCRLQVFIEKAKPYIDPSRCIEPSEFRPPMFG
jgi:hypothetical protein